MKKILIVVDVQKDFVDGALGTAEAQAMLPRLVEKMNNYEGEIIFTRDTHEADYFNTQEGRILPVAHCIRNTPGWELIPELGTWCAKHGCKIFDKPTFGSVAMAKELRQEYAQGILEEVELVGLCTDICVASNALLLKAYMPELPIKVDPTCCAGVTPEKHKAALDVMHSCQIII